MELSELTMKVLFLFLPGIISCLLICNLTETKISSSFQFIVRAFVLGCTSYLILGLFYIFMNLIFNPLPKLNLNFFDNIACNRAVINFNEVLYVSICSFFLALLVSKFINKAYLNRFARILHISNVTGYKNVWHKLLSKDEIEWILVKDRSKNLMYEGWIEQYSSEYINGELFLRDVSVYNDLTGEKYYDLEGLYLVFNSDNMTIEFRQFSKRSDKNGRSKKRRFFFRKGKELK